MNGKQKVVRAVGLILLVLSALYPPWKLSYNLDTTGVGKSSFVGYRPLWDPPAEEIEVDEHASNLRYHVDFVRLGCQLAGILVLLNVGVYLLKPRMVARAG
ncbi:MAG: hypothetical protein FJ403_22725 [Verrucomicrobia bacterium]|nr:hypothetical protein [Verrucomicrobiota bacterium]